MRGCVGVSGPGSVPLEAPLQRLLHGLVQVEGQEGHDGEAEEGGEPALDGGWGGWVEWGGVGRGGNVGWVGRKMVEESMSEV
jgi:hypothetical protein